jgi:D-galactose 1-dehydrogenase
LLTLDGEAQAVLPEEEYPAMYRHFVALIRGGMSDVDVAPLQLVADAFMRGRTTVTEAFEE